MHWLTLYLSLASVVILIIISLRAIWKSKRRMNSIINEHNNLLAAIAEMPVCDVKPLVDNMLADTTMFSTKQEIQSVEKYCSRLSPLVYSFFNHYGHVKNLPLDYELSHTYLEEISPIDYLLIGKDTFNNALIYVTVGKDLIAVRGDGYDYSVEFSTIYHFIYAQERIRQLTPDIV